MTSAFALKLEAVVRDYGNGARVGPIDTSSSVFDADVPVAHGVSVRMKRPEPIAFDGSLSGPSRYGARTEDCYRTRPRGYAPNFHWKPEVALPNSRASISSQRISCSQLTYSSGL